MRQTYTARVPGLEPAAIGCGAFVRMTVHATVLLAALSTKASARFTGSLAQALQSGEETLGATRARTSDELKIVLISPRESHDGEPRKFLTSLD